MAASEQPAQAGMITAAQAAALLDLTEHRIRQLVREGFIPKPSRNSYPLVGTVRGYIKFLREENRRNTQSAAESGLKATRQAEIELRMAERRRDLVQRSEADAAMDMVVGQINEEFGGFAARATRDVAIRREIEKVLDAALNAVADRLSGAKLALATGGDNAPAQAEDNA